MKFILSIFCLTFVNLGHAKPVSFMQYNVENFFDTIHDAGTDDWTYLPLDQKMRMQDHTEACHKTASGRFLDECLHMDWTEAKFTKKIINISKVIKSFDNTGKGPDILMIEEVENMNVISKLVSKGLNNLGYQYKVLIDGDDNRGIDVGLISKYPIVKAMRHPLIIRGQTIDTRGILQVTLNVDNHEVTVFVNHWPSQSNPTEHRVASAQLLDSIASKLNSDLIIAAGDFNTIRGENPYPFNQMRNWTDAEAEARKQGVRTNPGTHFYRGEWSSLDHIFIHNKSAAKPDYKSFQIIARPFMLRRDHQSGEMTPIRYNFETGEGFSDHLPMGIVIDIK